jgi:hypothetical protein
VREIRLVTSSVSFREQVLLCLLSEQPVPNLLAVHLFRPARLLLVETAYVGRRKGAENFLRALDAGGVHYEAGAVTRLSLAEEDSLVAMEACLERVKDLFADREILVNLTGGTKPMALGTFRFFSRNGWNARFLYTNVSRPQEVLDLETQKATRCAHELSLEEFLCAYGFTMEERPDGAERERDARDLWPVALAIARHCRNGKFLTIDNVVLGEYMSKGAPLGDDMVRDPELFYVLLRVFAGRALTAGEWRFLNGGWLEGFVAGLLLRHRNALGISDLRIGVHVKDTVKEGISEFDVAFMCRNTLYVVECKSGRQASMKDPNEPLDKLTARVRQLGALRARAILACTSEKLLDGTGALRNVVSQRAFLYGIRVLTAEDIRVLAERADDAAGVAHLLGVPI